MRWGLLAYGRIARKMEESILASAHDQIVAVASQSQFDQIPSHYKKYSNYHDLLADKEVEIVYISTTHNHHKQWTIAALEAGKHVLCEKPMSISLADTYEMIKTAREHRRFLTEAIWTRYLPAYQRVKSIIERGDIGDIQLIQANFGFAMNPNDPKERLIDPALAAGAIWDVGIYPLALIVDFIDSEIETFDVIGHLTNRQVDNRVAVQYFFESGQMAQLTCAVDVQTHNIAVITGNRGIIVMNDFWKCESFFTFINGHRTDYFVPMTSTGLYHELVACQTYIQRGLLESDQVPWQHTIRLSAMMDELLERLNKTSFN